MVDVVPCGPRFLEEMSKGREVTFPVSAYLGLVDGAIVAAGGLAWRFDRCWLWLVMTDRSPKHAVHVVRWARRMLRKAAQLGEKQVFCWRDDEPSSARLLTLVGMHPIGIEQIILEDGTVLGEKEVWSNVRS